MVPGLPCCDLRRSDPPAQRLRWHQGIQGVVGAPWGPRVTANVAAAPRESPILPGRPARSLITRARRCRGSALPASCPAPGPCPPEGNGAIRLHRSPSVPGPAPQPEHPRPHSPAPPRTPGLGRRSLPLGDCLQTRPFARAGRQIRDWGCRLRCPHPGGETDLLGPMVLPWPWHQHPELVPPMLGTMGIAQGAHGGPEQSTSALTARMGALGPQTPLPPLWWHMGLHRHHLLRPVLHPWRSGAQGEGGDRAGTRKKEHVLLSLGTQVPPPALVPGDMWQLPPWGSPAHACGVRLSLGQSPTPSHARLRARGSCHQEQQRDEPPWLIGREENQPQAPGEAA